MISRLDHAAYLGQELARAERAMELKRDMHSGCRARAEEHTKGKRVLCLWPKKEVCA